MMKCMASERGEGMLGKRGEKDECMEGTDRWRHARLGEQIHRRIEYMGIWLGE